MQDVLPGATATEFWNIAGLPVETLPNHQVTSGDETVDASLAGLAQGEFVYDSYSPQQR